MAQPPPQNAPNIPMPFRGPPIPGMPGMPQLRMMPGGLPMPGPIGPGGINFIPSPFMSQLGLPPAIMALFAPRPPIEYKPPLSKRKMPPLSGIAPYTSLFETEKPSDLKPWKPPESKRQKKERISNEKKLKNDAQIKEQLKSWDQNKSGMTAEPLNTLFVARINYETTEQKLRREFEIYGEIRTVRMVYDRQGKPRGYGFIEFERDKDMVAAYKHADGKKIDGRRVLVDVEKGRTVSKWKPRRLGGGLGATRAGGDDVNQKYSGREPPADGKERSRERDDRDKKRDRRDDRDRDRDRRDKDRDRDRRDRDRDRDRRDRSRGRDRDRDRRDDRRDDRKRKRD